MNTESNMEFLRETIAELQGGKIHNFTIETRLSDLGLDSLDVVELQMAYEDKMNIVIDDPTEALVTIGDLLLLMK